LRGTWVPIDPREWRNGFTATINVGLGTGNRDQQIQQLMALLNEQKQGMQFGIATPMNVYAAEQELVKALGFKNGDKFWTDPAKNPPPQQQPPYQVQIEQMRQQADAQKFQVEQQADIQRFQAETQMTREIEQIKANAKLQEIRANLELQAANDARDSERETLKAQYDAQMAAQKLEFEKQKMEFEAQTKIYIEEMKLRGVPPADYIQEQNNMTQVLQGLQAVIAQMSAPKRIVRDPVTNRAIGVEHGQG
jgi:hypothetical protein